MTQRLFSSVAAGDELPGFEVVPSSVQMMRYCAVTWNMHRIHFDAEQAAAEGYPGLIVQSHLHQAFLTRLITDWMGPRGQIRSLSATVRRFATAGDTLRLRGRVVETDRKDDFSGLVTIDIEEVRPSDGIVCAPGRAVVELPVLASPDVVRA